LLSERLIQRRETAVSRYLSMVDIIIKSSIISAVNSINRRLSMSVEISANDIKRRGISYVEKYLESGESVLIRAKYTIIPIAKYDELRELELDNAIKQAEEDYKEKRYVTETTEDHFKRLGI